MRKEDIVVGTSFTIKKRQVGGIENIIYTIIKILDPEKGSVELSWIDSNGHPQKTSFPLGCFLDYYILYKPFPETLEERVLQKIEFLYRKQRRAGIRI